MLVMDYYRAQDACGERSRIVEPLPFLKSFLPHLERWGINDSVKEKGLMLLSPYVFPHLSRWGIAFT